jgi:chemotaxis protein methyltransferase CheR
MEQTSPAVISEHELSEICHVVERRSGILFDESRTRFLKGRLNTYLRDKGLTRGTDLLRNIQSSNTEYDALLERVLTRETSFFRYPAVYQALQKRVLPEVHARKFWKNPRTLRIWSAGCSTGEEPYSIAITVAEALESADVWEIEILATDISRQALDVAERASYSQRDLGGLEPGRIESFLVKSGPDEFRVKPKVKKMVTFAPMNLAQMVYMGRFDCIFCMNVLIYFSEELRASLIRKFYEYLEPEGYLFLGHAESVARTKVDLEAIVTGDSLMYRKSAASIARAAIV